MIDCDAEILLADDRWFHARNRFKRQNFIFAEVTTSALFKYHVTNLPKDGTGCPGVWLLNLAWEHFHNRGVEPAGIRGEWCFGDNLDEVNRLTQDPNVGLSDASIRTWAYRQALRLGFPHVVILDSSGSPGSYLTVDVLFSRIS